MLRRVFLSVLLLSLVSLVSFAEAPIAGVMDRILATLSSTLSEEQLLALDQNALQPYISPEDRKVFATEYWCFDVNVPVLVSVMRDIGQKIVPFWLPDSGFRKTDLVVRNAEYTYEVWQKAFEPGRVQLGINGFDKHRPHYFVSVGPQHAGNRPVLNAFFPSDQQIFEMKVGAYVYHDWPDLLLTEVPDALKGQQLLPTIRGRAREANLIGAFRKSLFPSGEHPDEPVLTWSGDPTTTQTIQWRSKVPGTTLRYRSKEADGAWMDADVESKLLTDRLIVNDPQVYHSTAKLAHLKPGNHYVYEVRPDGPQAEFTTASSSAEPFTFLFLTDTHCGPKTTDLLKAGLAKYPNPAFCTISGDLVGTGQYRDDWDALFQRSNLFVSRFPLMPSMGNHDNIDGMGSDLYCAHFSLPANGPAGLEPGRAYSFHYGNAFFLMPDVTAPLEPQTAWIEQQLRTNEAKWIFAVFHFPPYAPDDANPDIVQQWLPLFDRYHVDVVLTGHVHHYLRTYPMRAGQRTDSSRDGTVYYTSVSVAGPSVAMPTPDYAAKTDSSGTPLCMSFTVEAGKVTSRAFGPDGHIIDEYTIEK